ncbi:MAG: hypothetical protein WCH31_03240 [Actinomycetes bacterium]
MPSRKQRRTRAKSFRHEYVYVDSDDEGNVIELEKLPKAPEKKVAKKKSQPAKRGSRVTRDPEPPSWRRSVRRAVPMGALMMVIMVFMLKHSPMYVRIGWGVIYTVAFIPMTYWIDGRVYRTFQKRKSKGR